MNFEWALQQLRAGKHVRRKNEAYWLRLTDGSDRINAHRNNDSTGVVWAPDQADIIADDWELQSLIRTIDVTVPDQECDVVLTSSRGKT